MEEKLYRWSMAAMVTFGLAARSSVLVSSRSLRIDVASALERVVIFNRGVENICRVAQAIFQLMINRQL